MNEDLKNFASDLKVQREETNFSLKNIFQKTRIDVKFLEAIEDGRFDIIENVYLRAFIKSYAIAIGLDSDEVLKNFDLAREGKLHSLDKEQGEENKEVRESVKKKVYASDTEFDKDYQHKESQQQKFIAPLSIFIFIIAAFSVYFFFIKGDSNTIVKETPFNEVLAEKKNQSTNNEKSERFEVLPDDTSKIVPTGISGKKTKIKILAIDTTWVRITKDDQNDEEFLLVPGNTKNYNPVNNLKLLIGNAGGLNIYLNDSLLSLGSKKGEIKYVQISEEGLTFLKVQKMNTDAQQN